MLTHWRQQHMRNTAAIERDSSIQSECRCEDSTDELNNRSASQQQQQQQHTVDHKMLEQEGKVTTANAAKTVDDTATAYSLNSPKPPMLKALVTTGFHT